MTWSKDTKTQLRRIVAVLSLAILMHVQACLIFMSLDIFCGPNVCEKSLNIIEGLVLESIEANNEKSKCKIST